MSEGGTRAGWGGKQWFVLNVGLLLLNAAGGLLWLHRSAPGEVTVRLAAPADGVVAKRDPVVWQFSADMVAEDATRKWTPQACAAFAPAVKGLFCWQTPRELIFRPQADWPPCAPFSATLDAGLRGTRGQPLAPDARSVVFRSPALAVLRVAAQDSAARSKLQIRFNAPVTADALRAKLRVSDPEGKALTFRVVVAAPGLNAVVALDGAPPPGTPLTVLVQAGLPGATGPLALPADVQTNIVFSTALQIGYVKAEDEGLEGASLHFGCSASLDLSGAADLIRTDPPLPLSVESIYSWQDTAADYRVRAGFVPGQRYTITFRQGLRSSQGHTLTQDVSRTVLFPDAASGLRLLADGNYLSPRGRMAVPLQLLNVASYDVTVSRIFANNLVELVARRTDRLEYYYGDDHQGLARAVSTFSVKVQAERNRVVQRSLDLRGALGGRLGAFHLHVTGDGGDSAEHYVVVSDIGLSVKRAAGELLVWANSLHTLAPVAGAEVRLLSRENQQLLTGVTDAAGLVHFTFEPGTLEGDPYLLTAQAGEDLTFLALDETRLALPNAVGDRPYDRPYDAFVYTDCGIYRPGATCHVRAFVREPAGGSPEAFPVSLSVRRPDGQVSQILTAELDDMGAAEFTVPFPLYAATGTYRLELDSPGTNAPMGQVSVAVEEFVPPQIRVTVKTDEGRVASNGLMRFAVSAQYLFGSPASGLPVDATVTYAPQPFAPSGWEAFTFGDPRRSSRPWWGHMDRGALDADGNCAFDVQADPAQRPPAALKAVLSATVSELSGRAVTQYASHWVDLYPFYVGIRSDVSQVPPGPPHAFELVLLRPDGTPWPGERRLEAKVEKLTWVSVLKKDENGRHRYTSEEQAAPVTNLTVVAQDGRGVVRFRPGAWGAYRLIVEDKPTGAAAVFAFHAAGAGQRALAWSMENPDRVELALDRPAYRAGETARLLIKAPFTGKALLTLESDRVLHKAVLVLTNNTAEVTLPVLPAYAPNVYACVTVIRPVVPEKIWGQHRAAGRVALRVEQPARRLFVALAAPAEMRPRQTLELVVAVSNDLGQAETAEITVAAVDEGICLLTDFATPDPYGYFTAPRQPGVEFHDFYASLMPELEAGVDAGASHPGGDEASLVKRRLNPVQARRFRPVMLWSGSVRTGADGRARVSFEVPEFTGALRLMAVACTRARFGSAAAAVRVRRPLIVQSSLPRFVAPGDTFSLPVTLINESAADAEASLQLTFGGPLRAQTPAACNRRVALPRGKPVNLSFAVRAEAVPGVATARLAVVMGPEAYEESEELAVRPASALVTVAGNGRVGPGETARLKLPAAWLGGTGRARLWASPLPAVQLAGGLEYLVRYPYGCLEQTTSQSFPLLYLADMAATVQPGWLERADVARLVQAGTDRILSLQLGDGSFALWPGGETYVWGTLYASRFLVEAAKAEFPVPADRVEAATDWIANWLANEERGSSNDAVEQQALHAEACLVLARAGHPAHGWMARLVEGDGCHRRDARACLASAFLAAGKRRDARALLDTIEVAPREPTPRTVGGVLTSTEREDALLLSAWLDADPDHAAVPVLVRRLQAAQVAGRWYTTHDNALALMALGQYCKRLAGKRQPMAGRVTWNDGRAGRDVAGGQDVRVDLGELREGAVMVRNTGKGPLYYTWQSSGVPADGAVAEADEGLTVRRAFFDAEGEAVSLEQVRQGEIVVVQVDVAAESEVDNVVITDLLPAGLEVENAGLSTAQTLPWVKERQTLPLRHLDQRDDRVLAFTGAFEGAKSFCYVVRAVTPGAYTWPAIQAECMYDAAVRSVNGRGQLKVEGR